MNENMKAVDVLAVMERDDNDARKHRIANQQSFPMGARINAAFESEEARAAVVDAVEALKLAERTISATLAARGYQNGECTDGWVQEVRDEVAALVPIRAALSRCGGAK